MTRYGPTVPEPDDPRNPDWTVEDAAAWFTESGIPCTGDQLAAIIAKLPGFRPVGRAPSPPQGGVGKNLYKMRDLMSLHSRLAVGRVP